MSCGVGHRHSSDLVLLWLWHRPVATACIQHLAWELLYATGTAIKKTNKKNCDIFLVTNPSKDWRSLCLCKNCLQIYWYEWFLLFYEVLMCWNIFWKGTHSWHMELPRLGVESVLQLQAYTTATATTDLTILQQARSLTHWARYCVRFLTHWAKTETLNLFSR